MSAAESIALVQRTLAPLVRDGTPPGYVAAVSVDGDRRFCCDGRLARPGDVGAGEPAPAEIGEDVIFVRGRRLTRDVLQHQHRRGHREPAG
jgi:hypothetical protein